MLWQLVLPTRYAKLNTGAKLFEGLLVHAYTVRILKTFSNRMNALIFGFWCIGACTKNPMSWKKRKKPEKYKCRQQLEICKGLKLQLRLYKCSWLICQSKRAYRTSQFPSFFHTLLQQQQQQQLGHKTETNFRIKRSFFSSFL